MNNIVHVQFMQSNTFAQLKEQFERIDEIIESGKTVTLDLTDNNRSISLTIDRNNVVKKDLPLEPRKTRSLSDNDSLTALVSNRFSFDIGDINRQVKPDDIEAQINKASVKKPDEEAERKMQSVPADDRVALPGLPNPAIRFIGNDTWVITEDCVYTTNDDVTITVKTGFKTDLASIPRIFWAFIATFELSVAAPVFHDLIYRSGGEVALPDGEVAPIGKILTRQEADNIFLELMTLAKISYWKRRVAYFAVETFAGFAWRKATH